MRVTISSLLLLTLLAAALPGQYLTPDVAVVRSLRDIHQAQVLFHAFHAMDDDQDGLAEYGSLGELSGLVTTNVRGGVAPVLFPNPPLLGPAYQAIDGAGNLNLHGYLFRLFLPDANAQGIGDVGGGGPAPIVATNQAEQVWCCYAWPAQWSPVGGLQSCFMVNQTGIVAQTGMDAALYYGAMIAPTWDAAFLHVGSSLHDPIALAQYAPAVDGNTWLVSAVAELDVFGTPSLGSTLAIQVRAPSWNVPYALGLSTTAQTGIPLMDGRVLPLDPTPLLYFSLLSPSPVIANQFGTLNAFGTAPSPAPLSIPSSPQLVGSSIFLAAITTDPNQVSGVGAISPAWQMTFVP